MPICVRVFYAHCIISLVCHAASLYFIEKVLILKFDLFVKDGSNDTFGVCNLTRKRFRVRQTSGQLA